MGYFKNLLAYSKAYDLSIEIHRRTSSFPKDELYALTSQIRRSSRSVCANLAEAYRRRRTIAHFVSKLNDAEAENIETEVWLSFSVDLKYISTNEFTRFSFENNEVGRLLNYMINNPIKFM